MLPFYASLINTFPIYYLLLSGELDIIHNQTASAGCLCLCLQETTITAGWENLMGNEESAKKMFAGGFSPAQSLLYKTYSKVQSTRNIKTLVKRIKKIPDFLISRRYGKGIPREKGYCYFQQFINNNGYDIKIAVVGDKCSYFARNVRKGSFKASGGGDFFYDHSLIKKALVKSAFKAADNIGMQCVGFDYVVDKKTGKGLIIEMCYGFDFKAVYDCGGYWDRNFVWHNEPLNVPLEVVKNMIE